MNSSLQQARVQSTFPVNKLSELIYGGPEKLASFMKYQNTIAQDPILKFDPSLLGGSKRQIFNKMCQKTLRYHEVFSLDNEDFLLFITSQFEEPISCFLQITMFLWCMQFLASDKQAQQWMPLVKSFQMLGCYAQTELGHGSDVQNIETTATFDKTTDTFIINTPSVSAAKYWIGDLGVIANYAIVFAQLIIDGAKIGVQPFLVQVRNLEDHQPMPGIRVGDIGPKYGFTAKDNGYLVLNNVKIPRMNMLMKYVSISREGEMEIHGNPKMIFSIMLRTRVGIINTCYQALAQAVTIGARYSIVRKQFKADNGQETQILDYQLQSEKILVPIAESYAICFAFCKILDYYRDSLIQFQNDNFSELNELHSLSSALKAYASGTAVTGIEKVRRACGGHGFSSYSGFTNLFKFINSYPTLEGENTILMLQTARFLLKNYKNAITKKKEISNQVEYLNNIQSLLQLNLSNQVQFESTRELKDLNIIRKILRFNAAFKVHQAYLRLETGLTKKNLKQKEAWDTYANTFLIEASIAHIQYWIYQNFMNYSFSVNEENLRVALIKLCILFGVEKILENPTGLYQSGYLNGAQVKIVSDLKEELLRELKNETIGFVEAYAYTDNSLRSAIGNSQGNVYEQLWEWTQKYNEINKPEVSKAIYNEFKPLVGFVKAPKL